jgi:antitoxin ParD1/3/4
MNVNLTPRLEAMVREKVESGLYNNASEVVREALREMERKDQLERLRKSLQEADEQVARGDYYELNDETWERIEREADEADRRGEPIDPDVWP